jgi:large subunit ribosomal protein L17
LGRNPPHQRALLRSLASNLFLTERDAEFDDNKPKFKGRIVTTLPKAKEVRPLVERCITLAKKAAPLAEAAAKFGTEAKRGSDAWKKWRESDQWKQWAQAMAPVVDARRRLNRMIGDKKAVRVLCETVAPRYLKRDGGYTRIVKLAKPRLGDAGQRAILELVGENDRRRKKSQAPKFESTTS